VLVEPEGAEGAVGPDAQEILQPGIVVRLALDIVE